MHFNTPEMADLEGSWLHVISYMGFSALLNACLMAAMIWFFNTRWRVADVRAWRARVERRVADEVAITTLSTLTTRPHIFVKSSRPLGPIRRSMAAEISAECSSLSA